MWKQKKENSRKFVQRQKEINWLIFFKRKKGKKRDKNWFNILKKLENL